MFQFLGFSRTDCHLQGRAFVLFSLWAAGEVGRRFELQLAPRLLITLLKNCSVKRCSTSYREHSEVRYQVVDQHRFLLVWAKQLVRLQGSFAR
jgi:hypothetical protein